MVCDGSGEDENCINQHDWWNVLTNVFIIDDHLKYLDVNIFDAAFSCNVDIGGYGSNGTTDDSSSNNGGYNGTGVYIETYEYAARLDVLIDWSAYDTVMYTSEDIQNSIGLQTLFNYGLREAAVRVRNDLKDDTDIHCSIKNITKMDNTTILLQMQVSFKNSTQFNGFFCEINLILDYFNDNIKTALSIDDVSTPLIYHYYDSVDTSDCDTSGSLATTENDANDGGGDSGHGEDDSGSDGMNIFGANIGNTELIAVLVSGVVLVVLILSCYYYKKRQNGKNGTSGRNDELSKHDSLQQQNIGMAPVYVGVN